MLCHRQTRRLGVKLATGLFEYAVKVARAHHPTAASCCADLTQTHDTGPEGAHAGEHTRQAPQGVH